MTEHSYTALRAYEQRMTGMLADPECVGELLLVGLVMARAIDLCHPPLNADLTLSRFAELVYGRWRYPPSLAVPGRHRTAGDSGPRRIADVIRCDRRRYEPTDEYGWVTCGRPMIRRQGVCGRPASDRRRLTDPLTGLRQYVGACTNTGCKAWYQGLVQRNEAELAEHPAPVPPANTGGVLDRHLPEIDWYTLWRHLDPTWVPPPEGEAHRKPKLRILINDEPELRPAAGAGRPVLTALNGGWR